MKPTAKYLRAAAALCDMSASWLRSYEQPASAKYMNLAARDCRAAARATKKTKKKGSK